MASKEERRLGLGNFLNEILQQLNSTQLSPLQKRLKREAHLWKQSFKFIEKESHQVSPNYIFDQFGLPEPSKKEPC